MISENARQNSINSYVTKSTYIINTLLLLYHVFFGFLFYKNQAHYLYYFNYISILTYLVCYFILYKQKSYLYIAVVFLEIYVFMLLSVIGIGWDYGFQQYCFSFVASLLFTDFYMNKRHKLRKTTTVSYTHLIYVPSVPFHRTSAHRRGSYSYRPATRACSCRYADKYQRTGSRETHTQRH